MGLALKITLWPFIFVFTWAVKYGIAAVRNLLGFFMWKGGRLVAGVFWLLVIWQFTKHADWVKAHLPAPLKPVWVDMVLLISGFALVYYLLRPRVRRWYIERTAAKAMSAMADTQRVVIEVKGMGTRFGRFLNRARRTFGRDHPSERAMNADDYWADTEIHPEDPVEVVQAKAAAQAAQTLKEEAIRATNGMGHSRKGRSKSEPKRRKRAPDDPYAAKTAEIRREVRDALDEMAGQRARRTVAEDVDNYESSIRDLVREEIRRQRGD